MRQAQAQQGQRDSGASVVKSVGLASLVAPRAKQAFA